ncbi:MAG: DNA repair protein RecN [Actinobacteria bacterium]|nr:DNA repair protein RecN [Actinomycetota bacterium]
MIRELRVRNLALLEEASLEFGPGLNVLTGETGAGKTVLVEALSLLLGGRGDSGMVRDGAERLELEAAFDVSGHRRLRELLEAEDLAADEGEELILRRVIGADGKSRCYVNGRLSTVGTLSRLGDQLVDIHGQHEHQRLLRPASHLEYLDEYGGPQHLELLRSYRRLYLAWREAERAREEADMDEAERLREMDLLRFQVREIEAVRPAEGEMEELLRERKRMQNREELFSAACLAHDLLAGDGGEGAIDRLGEAEAALLKASSLDEEAASWCGRLREAQETLAELARAMHDFAEGLEFEPGRLEEVEARLHALTDLARKYGGDTAAILEHLERSRRRLEELENLDERREDLWREAGAARAAAREAAERLSSSRQELARRLTQETGREMEELNMAGMRFRVHWERETELGPTGWDRVEFQVTPGKGLPYRSLSRIASGGELSRITLALKLALARADSVPTLVFDEVDAGIGGTTADVLAEKLARISAYHQVFSITHLPQIAARSHTHLAVSKRQTGKGIITEVRRLGAEERLEELVRMLGGEESTARRHARALLKAGAARQPEG